MKDHAADEPPWTGCLIPVVVAIVFTSLATCTVLTGVMQNRAIAEFTDPDPREFTEISPSPELLSGVGAKLERLASMPADGQGLSERFDVEELNAMIVSQELLESMRTTSRVRAITPAGIEIETSQPLRKLGGGFRYLNGTFVMVPARSETNQWQLMLQAVEVPGRDVPEGFFNMFRDLHVFRVSNDAEGVQAVLRRVERFDLGEGELRVILRAGGEGS